MRASNVPMGMCSSVAQTMECSISMGKCLRAGTSLVGGDTGSDVLIRNNEQKDGDIPKAYSLSAPWRYSGDC